MVQEFPLTRTVCLSPPPTNSKPTYASIPDSSSYLYSSWVYEDCTKVRSPSQALAHHVSPPQPFRFPHNISPSRSLRCLNRNHHSCMRIPDPPDSWDDAWNSGTEFAKHHCFSALTITVQLYTLLLNSAYYGCWYGCAGAQTSEICSQKTGREVGVRLWEYLGWLELIQKL